jgi:putative transposase
VPLQLARTVNEVWSMDFVSDSLSGGRRLKYLTVADDFSHESVDIAVDFGISGQYVTRLLDRARCSGLPAGRAHRQRPGVHQPGVHGLGADPRHSPHPDPAGAPDAERLHRELQRQVPRRAPERVLVRDIAPGREAVAIWRKDYNEVRPHSSLGRIPPARFAELHRQRAGDAAQYPSTQ